MMAFAAVALASCSNHEVAQLSQAEIDKAKYDQAFLRYVGGNIAADQDWGFSATRSNNPGEDYPATSGHINANGNEWAASTTGANPKEFGGWVVPDVLTDGQKLRVKAYFQSHPNLTYEDPHLRHFFVQQVYTGGSDPSGVSAETITAANGNVSNSSVMGALYVGPNVDEDYKINNFTDGTASYYPNVLDNGEDVNTGKHHSDQIMLMVNVDNTSTFTYTESASSSAHNNKCALVSAAVIDAWAVSEGNNIGEAVTDSWNRSFLGFDLALKEGAEAYATDEGGNVVYATYAQAPETPQYAWDGEKVIQIADGHNEDWTPKYLEGYENIFGVGFLTTNQNFYVAADKVTLAQTYQNGEIQAATLTDVKDAVVIKDLVYDGNKYQAVINLPKIQQLVNDGYLPVRDKSLTEWVKVGKSDGYFTDWIVTLTEAQRQDEEPAGQLRIIAEDLSATEASDFDFNDIVLDVTYGSPATVKLVAAGGTLPLCINMDEELEVHKLFGVELSEMVNTGKGPNKAVVDLTDKLNLSIQNAAEANTKLRLWVKKNGEWQEMTAPKGEPACKLAVDQTFTILSERQSIKAEYPLFVEWATANNFSSKWWTTTNE